MTGSARFTTIRTFHRRCLGLALAAATIAACSGGRESPQALRGLTSGAARGFNVLLITLDTTRADRIGAYGHAGAETPALDALAARGLRFDDAVTVVPLTLPAHSSMLTGLYPPNHGVRTNGQRLDEKRPTLAGILSDNGYATAAFVSSFVLDPRFGLSRGFEHYDARVDATAEDAFGGGNDRSAGRVTQAALDWIARRDVARPFFAWVHYFDPHHLYRPPAEFGLRFADRPYDGEIAYVDSEIGRLVARLRDWNLAERTVIVVAGDHGESLGEHGERFHGRTLYESAVRVPLILSADGLIDEGAVIDDRVVSLVDVFPTVLHLLGVEAPGEVDGVSLVGAPTEPDRLVYLESAATFLDNGWAPLYAVRSHGEKYVEAPRPELYDLAADPGEHQNRYGAAASRSRLARHLQDLAGRWPTLQVAKQLAEQMDAETRSRLAALGYVSQAPRGPQGPLVDPKDALPAHERMIEAEAMAAAGRYDDALQRLGEVVNALPQSREVYHRLGEIYARLDRPEEAERALRKSLGIGLNPPAAALLSQVLAKQRRFDEAGRLVDQAEAMDPRYGGVYVARADLLVLQGRPREAIPLYERALEVDPYRAAGIVRARLAAVRARMAAGVTTGPSR